MIKFAIILGLLFSFTCAVAQEENSKNLELSGYISSVQSVAFDSIQKNWTTESLIHNRLNFKWFAGKSFKSALEVRNRLVFGETIKQDPKQKDYLENDNGFLDLSINLLHGKSYVFNSAIDRLWLAYEKNKWCITLGRQRINWSQTWVWNPNDIFNAYSFFDIDYIEKPGSDALRVQYYNNEVTTTEFAIKLNQQNKITAAGYYKFNKWNYDFQVLGGILNESDYVIGTGWSGAIKNVALRGELSYFIPVTQISDSSDLFMASLALDYTMGKFSLLAEFLYSSSIEVSIDDFMSVYTAPLSVKNLAFVNYNLLAQVSYPITPLLNASVACMYLPPIKGYYLGPSINFSASDNIEFALFLQSFGGNTKNQYNEIQKLRFNLLFLRAKISF